MATFPDAIASFRTKTNRNGVVYDADKQTVPFAEDNNLQDDEIVAIETELGTNPKGAYESVKAWLTALAAAISAKMTNPMNAAGDIIYGGASGAPTRLAKGTNLQMLSQVSDIPSWVDDVHMIELIIDGGGSAIATGEKGHIEIPFKCEILQCTLLADVSGAIKIDIWKDTYANFPPTNADTITGGNEPEIAASGVKDQDATLTSWTKTLEAGSVVAFNVDSCATITRCTISLKVKKIA
jgi:hypothetical protein